MRTHRVPLAGLARRGDLALAVLLGIVVFLMILPMPTVVVDAFIAINIAGAIVLLMVGVYIPSPLSFSSLPSVLLLSTLFRLALTITTTRLILSQADAGEIVYAFGDFVVAGNLVVGVVVFLIITIVQFIVITKGAERVAEVCARFSLDGMPGKQMSIDADLRAGVIDTAEAVRRRARLEQQSQLYGSMDGAMKFVKGDAIAGLCIIVVNIVGGIAIGVFQLEMSLADAVSIYTRLTVGDGLVGQIPALFIAITAGIIVTRITSDDIERDLGSDIGRQILAHPNALLVAAAACFGLALLPGFPSLVFLVFGAVIGGIGLALRTADRQRRGISDLTTDGEDAVPAQTTGAGVTPPLALALPSSHTDAPSLRALGAEIARERASYRTHWGLQFPKVHLRTNAALDESSAFTIEVRGVPVAGGQLPAGRLHYAGTLQSLVLLGVPVAGDSPDGPDAAGAAATAGVWLDPQHATHLGELGYRCRTHAEFLAHELSGACERHAADLFGLQEAKSLLDAVQRECPDVVKELNRTVTLMQLTQVLKRLVAERVGIRDLPRILETLADAGREEKDPAVLAECVRVALGRQICHSLGEEDGVLPVLMLGADAEAEVRACLEQDGGQAPAAPLARAPRIELEQRLLRGLEAFRRGREERQNPVVLAPADIRRGVRDLLSTHAERTPVLSYAELSEEGRVLPVGELRLA